MSLRTRNELKEYYKAGSKASESQYVDLIDSLLNKEDDSSLIEHPVILGKTIFVDAGAVGTGERGNIIKPFNNPQAALSVAVTGDLILIFPGTYSCSNLYKPGVKYFAFPGVKIVHDGSAFALFTDYNQSAGECSFYGKADFETSFQFIRLDNNETRLIIYGSSLAFGESSQPCMVSFGDNTIELTMSSIVSDSLSSFLISSTVSCTLKADFLEIRNVLNQNSFCLGSGKQFFIEVKQIRALNYNTAVDSSLFTVFSINSICIVKNTSIITTASTLVSGGGNIFIDNVLFITKNEFGSSALSGSSNTTVKNSEFILDASQTGQSSVSGTDVEIIGMLSTNMPAAVGTTFKVGEFNYNTNLIA